MLIKKYNNNNQKAYQREDTEDRSLKYKNWLRTVETNGFYLDVDLVKWRTKNGILTPIAITEITRCDSEAVGQNYLDAIIDRWYNRDKQAAVCERLGQLLHVPVFLILYQKDINWFYVYCLNKKKWRMFLPSQWAEYLRSI
jgi:hypothetical protein